MNQAEQAQARERSRQEFDAALARIAAGEPQPECDALETTSEREARIDYCMSLPRTPEPPFTLTPAQRALLNEFSERHEVDLERRCIWETVAHGYRIAHPFKLFEVGNSYNLGHAATVIDGKYVPLRDLYMAENIDMYWNNFTLFEYHTAAWVDQARREQEVSDLAWNGRLTAPRSAVANAVARTVIRYDPSNLLPACKAAIQAVLADPKNGRVFRYGRQFARIAESKAITALDGLSSLRKVTCIDTLEGDALKARVMRSVSFAAFQRGQWTDVQCPREVVSMIAADNVDDAPRLSGVVSAPLVLPNGCYVHEAAQVGAEPIDLPGWEARTGLYLDYTALDYSSLLATPGVKAAASALQYLREVVLDEFPFASPLDRDVAVAAILTAVQRAVMPIAPAFAINAPSVANGKTALMQLIASTCTGQWKEAQTFPASDEELNKILISSLRAGEQVIAFDNLPAGKAIGKEAPLAALLTSDKYTGRLLGASEMLTLPAQVLVMVTGNRLAITDDGSTRFLTCTLDTQTETAHERSYKRQLRAWSLENRAEIVTAALTIVKAGINAEALPSVKSTRYPDWDRMVRLPLMVSGGLDVAAKFTQAMDQDDETAALHAFLVAWETIFGDRAVKSRDVEHQLRYPEAAEAEHATTIKEWLADGDHRALTATKIGMRLRDASNRLTRGRQLQRIEDKKNGGHFHQLAVAPLDPK